MPVLDFVFASPSEIQKELGARLQQQRLAHGWSQRELAARAGFALGSLRSMEQGGNASLRNWLQVLQVLDLVGELQEVLALKSTSIAEMEAHARLSSRKRAPRQRPSPP